MVNSPQGFQNPDALAILCDAWLSAQNPANELTGTEGAPHKKEFQLFRLFPAANHENGQGALD
jgi:hypothetical protein